MKTANDGGAAFPCIQKAISEPGNSEIKTYYGITEGQPGMSLRDYFAAAVLQGMLTSGSVSLTTSDTTVGRMDGISALAYRMADSMLAERAKETT